MANNNSPSSLKDIPLGETHHPETFWHHNQHKHLLKLMYRSIHLRNNTDYQIRYPHECKNCKPNEVHPEAKLRIMKEHTLCLEKAITPTTLRPARFNRVG